MSSTNSVVLGVQGHVPAFKNSKMIVRGNRLITKPEYKKWMENCIQSFVSQLIFSIKTIEGEIPKAQQVHSWIASSIPEDDCWQCIPEIVIKATRGNAGATITIERL